MESVTAAIHRQDGRESGHSKDQEGRYKSEKRRCIGKAEWGKQCKERQDGEQYRKGRMGKAVQGKAVWGAV